jgi:4-carboxymuconolactone decarboxylase
MRLAVLSSDEMTPEQKDLYREILGGPRGQGPRAVPLASGAGGLAGPFNAMLYAPPVGHALQELGAAIRFRTELAPRIREMAILVVAQVWDSAYERASHEPIGREAGLTDEEIGALRGGADPGFADKQEQVAYSVVRALTRPASAPWSSCPRWSATTRRWPCSCASSASTLRPPSSASHAARMPRWCRFCSRC